jgi:hypothetical protein
MPGVPRLNTATTLVAHKLRCSKSIGYCFQAGSSRSRQICQQTAAEARNDLFDKVLERMHGMGYEIFGVDLAMIESYGPGTSALC